MKKKRRLRNRQTDLLFQKFMLFLFVSILFLTFFSIIGFDRLNEVIRQRDDQLAQSALEQVNNAGELMIEEMINTSEDICGDEFLVDFSNGSQKHMDEAAMRLQAALHNPLIQNIYVVSVKNDLYLSANGPENRIGITAMLDSETQKKVLSPKSFSNRFLLLRLTPDEKYPSMSSLLFARPVVDENGERVGMLLFLLNKNIVNIRTGAYLLTGNYELCWLNDSDELVYTTSPSVAELPLSYVKLYDKSKQVLKNPVKNNSVCCYTSKSALTEIAFTLISPNRYYFSTAVTVYLPVLLCLIMIFAVIFVFVYKYLRLQSRTILNSLNILADTGIVNMTNDEDAGLEKLVVKLVAEREVLSTRLARYRSLDFDRNLERLLKGESVDDDQLKFVYPNFCVCAISIDNQSLFVKEDFINASEEKVLIKLVVDNVLNEHYKCYSRYNGNKIICLFNIGGDTAEEAVQIVDNELTALCQVCQQELELVFVCGVSHVLETRTRLNELYKEAINTLEYAMIRSQPVIFYEDVENKLLNPETEANYYKRLIEKEHVILESCYPWNYKNLCSAVNEWLKLLTSRSDSQFDYIQTKSLEVEQAILGILRQNRLLDDYSQKNEEEDRRELSVCNTSEQIRVVMLLFLKKIDDCVTKRKAEEQDYFLAKVENILETNFSDMSLSVSMIAEKLNMPMRLASSQYKAKTGYGLLDRIHSFRIEKAKKLLLETQDSVYEIAEKTGYENVNTFIRVFKKHTGKTPGRFRGNVDD